MVIKTIRLTAEHAREIFKNADNKEDLKIIHLIRKVLKEIDTYSLREVFIKKIIIIVEQHFSSSQKHDENALKYEI